ncbi:MAG: DUF1800 domain-containing protein [Saprospiraceae bacterium]|nr:DUF1800 domain-containing protein [Saprospiraceae bacterium]
MSNYNILNRSSYGPTPESMNRLEELGYHAFIEEQLNPVDKDDHIYKKKYDSFSFYSDQPFLNGKTFHYLEATLSDLWGILKSDKSTDKKSDIPPFEVCADTFLRAIYSKWQLRELLVQFWHNHFNVSIEAGEPIAVTLPIYDRDVIRKNCFGNFRVFLEDVAKSQSMLFYLDNVFSRASPANENYARELFELHTLGEDNYLNHLYNKWKEVPGAENGQAAGYIDEDVYEAARAFTGWTVADGQWTEDGHKPDTGAFVYMEKLHDNYQKRVLGVEFDSNQPPMADGRKVLDILASHHGTARFLCKKLCRRFLGDNPAKSIIEKAVSVWIEHQKSSDQIKRVVRVILTSQEFKDSLGTKFKNPLELVISMFRVLGLDVVPNMHLKWMLRKMGYKLFSWPTPTGHPDYSDYWLNSNMLLKRWNFMPLIFFNDWHKLIKIDFDVILPEKEISSKEIVDHWTEMILGDKDKLPLEHKQKLIKILLSENKTENDPPFTYNDEDRNYRFANVLSLILMSPNFQYR